MNCSKNYLKMHELDNHIQPTGHIHGNEQNQIIIKILMMKVKQSLYLIYLKTSCKLMNNFIFPNPSIPFPISWI